MRQLIRSLLLRPVNWIANHLTSDPDKSRVFEALTNLYTHIHDHNGEKGLVIPFDLSSGKFIVLSDLHKGVKNGADNFMGCEDSYTAALDHYDQQGFHYICLGDSEELWGNNIFTVQKKNTASIEKEKAFIRRNAFTKVFGNHDLFWDQAPFASAILTNMYGQAVPIYEALVLTTQANGKKLDIFMTHGHQGDRQADGNWFSKFFISVIWGPLEAYLRINPNTPAYDSQLKTLHNSMMYEWSSGQKDLLLITGHTHQPVFESLTLLERLFVQLDQAHAKNDAQQAAALQQQIEDRKWEQPVVANAYEKIIPSYFNSGCCCFSDGDITGIEIDDGSIRLVRWKSQQRDVLEERKLADLLATPLG